jgi:hypothetical protein
LRRFRLCFFQPLRERRYLLPSGSKLRPGLIALGKELIPTGFQVG